MTDVDGSIVLKHLLLDLLSTTRSVEPDRLAALDEADWLLVSTMAQQHRLKPLLHQRIRSRGLQDSVPAEIVADWASSFRRASMRYLAFRRVLSKLDRLLNEASIPYAALKGAWLAQYTYTTPAERPLRDIDILVMPEAASTVYMMLENAGFARLEQYSMPLGDALEKAKHLPTMRCTETGIALEVHTRLIDTPRRQPDADTIENVPMILARREFRSGVPYLSSTDTMLHLIVHAAYDHQLNNGPLTFSDVALLMQTAPIDWAKFWTMAKVGEWERGCLLILELASYYHNSNSWRASIAGAACPSTEQIEAAALLSLQDFTERGLIAVGAEIAVAPGWTGKTLIFFRRAFPPLHILANFSGENSASRWSVLNYPRWLLHQAKRVRGGKSNLKLAPEVERAISVRDWIYEGNSNDKGR